MESTESTAPSTSSAPTMTVADNAFVLFLIFVVAAVTWLGVMNYNEGLKTEGTKRNGEVWLAWFTEAGAHRFDAGYADKACAGGPQPAGKGKDGKNLEPVANTWGDCVQHLLHDTPLKDLVNPFTGEQPIFTSACNTTDRSLTGAIVLENLKATPPGSAVPYVAVPLADTDPINDKVQIRVTICDKGSDAVKIGEIEF